MLLACSTTSIKDDEGIGSSESADIFDELEGFDEESDGNIPSEVMDDEGNSQTFYVTVGGEGWRRLAKALYNDMGAASELKELNQDIQNQASLEAGTNVYFDMERAMPRPEYLTKDMLERYTDVLSRKIVSLRTQTPQSLQEVTVVGGDTLQIISQKLYGTHRLWPELFLLNTGKIKDYDKIYPGMVLSYFPTVDFPSSTLRGKELALPSWPNSAPVVEEEEAQEEEYVGTGTTFERVPPSLTEAEPVETGMEKEVPSMLKEEVVPPAPVQDKLVVRKTIRPLLPVKKSPIIKDKKKVAASSWLSNVKRVLPKNLDGRTVTYGLLLTFIVLVGGASFFFIRNKKSSLKLFSSIRKSSAQVNNPFIFHAANKKKPTQKKEDDSVPPIRKVQ